MDILPLSPDHDAAMAAIIRANLKAHGLDVPGRAYYTVLEGDRVLGGIGLAEFRGDCCELQKLYLAEEAKGRGLGYRLIRLIEDRALALGYRQIYLETHTNLAAAIHVYERAGYREIPRPAGVVHSTMNRFFVKSF